MNKGRLNTSKLEKIAQSYPIVKNIEELSYYHPRHVRDVYGHKYIVIDSRISKGMKDSSKLFYRLRRDGKYYYDGIR
mgnify:FL=1